MIHQVKASDENIRLLRQIVDLQLVLLQLAADETVLCPSTDIQAGNVEIALRAFYPNNQQAKEVANWVTHRKLFDFLKDFAKHTDRDAKHEFVQGICHDIELIDVPKQARLKVAIKTKPPSWQGSARKFLLEFYGAFGSEAGFPAYLFKSQNNSGGFRRWDFIDLFTKVNPDLRLCAVCDSTLYRTTIGDRPYTSIEHFFPKSRYPHLVMHPLNLIPICSNCNSGAAGSIDPFGNDNLGVMGLILPYQVDRNFSGLGEQTYICVEPCSDRKMHPLRLEMHPNVNFPDATAFIANFERIYKVQERWNNDLEWIDQHVFRRITQFLLSDVQTGNLLLEPDFLIGRLRLLMALISKESLGQDPFGFAVIWLIKHHIDSLENRRDSLDTVPIYCAMRDWASAQQTHWVIYRDHADEIIRRVPSTDNDTATIS